MGGIVQLVVRKENDEIISLPVWTNSVSTRILKNPDFFNGDFSELDEFVNHHKDLISDYNQNKDTGKFSHPFTNSVGNIPFGSIYPLEYGIIVIDFKNKKIIDMQDYTNESTIMLSLKRTVGHQDIEAVSLSKANKDLEDIDKFLSMGYFKEVRSPYTNSEVISYDISNIKSLDELLVFLNEKLKDVEMPFSFKTNSLEYLLNTLAAMGKEVKIPEGFEPVVVESFMFDLVIDRKDFKVVSYKPKSSKNVNKIKEEIIKSGFILTDDDLNHWNNFSNR